MSEVYNLDDRLIKGKVPKRAIFPFSIDEWENLENYRITTSDMKGDVRDEMEFLELTKVLLPAELNILYRLVTHKLSKELINAFVTETNESINEDIYEWNTKQWKLISGASLELKLSRDNLKETLYTLRRIANCTLELHRTFVKLDKLGYDVSEEILNMRRFPLGNFKKAIKELNRIFGNPHEINSTNSLSSSASELPQMKWLNEEIPGFAKTLLSGEFKFSLSTYTKFKRAWSQQQEQQKLETDNKSKSTGKSQFLVNVDNEDIASFAAINNEQQYFDYFGKRFKAEGAKAFIRERASYISKVPGKVDTPIPPFSVEDWSRFRKNPSANKYIIVSSTKEIAPEFSRLVNVSPRNVRYVGMKWKQLVKSWAFNYLLTEFLSVKWVSQSDLRTSNTKTFMRHKVDAVSRTKVTTLDRLNGNAGQITSKVNTKANVSKIAKGSNQVREKLSYEERRKRRAQKYLNYLDDQMYYENHYVRPANTRQRHNDGGGWS